MTKEVIYVDDQEKLTTSKAHSSEYRYVFRELKGNIVQKLPTPFLIVLFVMLLQ